MNKTLKKILISLVIVVVSLIVIVGVYASYVLIQYYRIEDNLTLEINNNQDSTVNTNTEYSISTYNIGFGAYSQEYSFFMDTGEMKDGTKTKGIYGKGMSKEDVLKNTNGSIETIKNLNVDFAFFQEVDEDATRSYKINQRQSIVDSFSLYSNVYAYNFHTAYILYPFNDVMGYANSGILTLSKYQLNSSVRYQFPLSESLLDNLFDLDRCFTVSRTSVNGKELVLINMHMSAYDEGGVVRAKQMAYLLSILNEEESKGNYVIAGGDFNHNLNDTEFETQEVLPDWVGTFPKDELSSYYSVASSTNAPTCRSADIPYQEGVNYFVVIDGFIVSKNISVNSIETVDNKFMYSDHNPVLMKFSLNE